MKTLIYLTLIATALLVGSAIYINQYKTQDTVSNFGETFDCSSTYYDYMGRQRGGFGAWTIFRFNGIENQEQIYQCAQHFATYHHEPRGDMSRKILRTEFNIYFGDQLLDFQPIIQALTTRFGTQETPLTFLIERPNQPLYQLFKDIDAQVSYIILDFQEGTGNELMEGFQFPNAVKRVVFFDNRINNFRNFVEACSFSQNLESIEIYAYLPQIQNWDEYFIRLQAPKNLKRFTLQSYDRWVSGFAQSQMAAYRVERLFEQSNFNNLSEFLESAQSIQHLDLNISNVGLNPSTNDALRKLNLRDAKRLYIDVADNKQIYTTQTIEFTQIMEHLMSELNNEQLDVFNLNLMGIDATQNLIENIANVIGSENLKQKPIVAVDKYIIDQVQDNIPDTIELVPYKPMFMFY